MASRNRSGSLSVLERATVRPSAAERYQKEIADLEDFAKAKLTTFPEAQLDQLMVDYLEHLYFEGHTRNKGSRRGSRRTCRVRSGRCAGCGGWPPGHLARRCFGRPLAP